jgi:hypothetical protein
MRVFTSNSEIQTPLKKAANNADKTRRDPRPQIKKTIWDSRFRELKCCLEFKKQCAMYLQGMTKLQDYILGRFRF